VTAFVDTSVVVRYLMGDPAEMAERAATIIDGVEELHVTDVVLAETAYVLTSVYRVPRDVVVDHLVALLRKDNIVAHGLPKDLALQAMLLCRPSGRVSFADALVWAVARAAPPGVIYSFDQRFPAFGLELRSYP